MKKRSYKLNNRAKRTKRGVAPKKADLRLAVAEAVDLPKEILLDLPLLTVIGTRELRIENFKGIIEFSDERIRVNTSCGILKIEGKELILEDISSKSISVKGKISGYYFN